jgi:hypothetical protein
LWQKKIYDDFKELSEAIASQGKEDESETPHGHPAE